MKHTSLQLAARGSWLADPALVMGVSAGGTYTGGNGAGGDGTGGDGAGGNGTGGGGGDGTGGDGSDEYDGGDGPCTPAPPTLRTNVAEFIAVPDGTHLEQRFHAVGTPNYKRTAMPIAGDAPPDGGTQ